MNENVLSTFAFDKAEAFDTVNPLYVQTLCLPPLAILKNLGALLVPSEGKTKRLTYQTVSRRDLYFQHELTVILQKKDNTLTWMSQSIYE